MGVCPYGPRTFREWWDGEYVPGSDNAEQIVSESTPADMVIIQAKHQNTNVVYVGSTNSPHFELNPGETVQLCIPDLQEIYVQRTAGSAGDGINYVAGLF